MTRARTGSRRCPKSAAAIACWRCTDTAASASANARTAQAPAIDETKITVSDASPAAALAGGPSRNKLAPEDQYTWDACFVFKVPRCRAAGPRLTGPAQVGDENKKVKVHRQDSSEKVEMTQVRAVARRWRAVSNAKNWTLPVARPLIRARVHAVGALQALHLRGRQRARNRRTRHRPVVRACALRARLAGATHDAARRYSVQGDEVYCRIAASGPCAQRTQPRRGPAHAAA